MSPPVSPGVCYTDAQRQEAAEWFVIIHGEDEPNSDTLQSWIRWMDLSEENRVAFESVAQAWHGTTVSATVKMPSEEELRADSYEGEQSVGEWLTSKTQVGAGPLRFERRSVPRRIAPLSWAWLAAASVAAITVGILVMYRYFGPRAQTDSFTTKNGEQIEITLADGSRVWLGPKSILQVGFTKDRRNIQLATGEAFFSVKKDHARPFVVRSSSGDITAVGTAFNVRAVTDHVTVSVSEGVVTVAPRSQTSAPRPVAVQVASGQELTFTAQEPIKALEIARSPRPGERARWRDGVLVYRDESLRDVVTDVARYSDKHLEISDGTIGDLRYTGVVYQGAVDEWASALPESFPVRLVSDGDREIIVAR